MQRHTRAAMSQQRWLTQLFDQQMWCFGQDILHPSGNVLLALGMCRQRSTDKRDGSMYSALTTEGGTIALWGFGAFYGEADGGLFLKRFGFAPKLTAATTGWDRFEPRAFTDLHAPRNMSERAQYRTRVAALVRWFGHYEHWIAEQYGHDYRAACLARRDQAALVPAQQMAHEWDRAARHDITFSDTPRPSLWTQPLRQLPPRTTAHGYTPPPPTKEHSWS